MDEYIVFVPSAFKHGVTKEDIRHAFTQKVYDYPVKGEEEKHLLIGFDTNAKVLEIMYNVLEPQKIRVFHAMPCRPAWRRLANQ
jgi:uncharacterized DUF497 family protein